MQKKEKIGSFLKKNHKKSENLLFNGLLHPFGVRNDEGSNGFAMTKGVVCSQ
jgi:hypothetical protein